MGILNLPGLQMEVTYLTSITNEMDPIKRAQILKEYVQNNLEQS